MGVGETGTNRMVTVQLICYFVFAFDKNRFSYDAARLLYYHCKCTYFQVQNNQTANSRFPGEVYYTCRNH